MPHANWFRAVLAVLMVATFVTAASAQQKADVFITAKGSPQRLTQVQSIPFTPQPQPDENGGNILVDATRTFQTIEGIGGALTDASAETFYKLPKARQDEVIRAYFDPTNGIGYTLGRTHIHSCDFSSEMYTYVERNDTALKSFSVLHDTKFRIPFIKRALAAAPGLKLFASPWSPPAWMKTNDDMLHGGKLKPEFYDAWARYFVKFVQAYQQAGIPIWGLTVQNEPMASQTWESCIFTANEERDFVKKNLGPTLQASGLGALKLMIWDHNRGLMFQRAAAVLEDPEAAKYVWGTAFHWYVGEDYRVESLVHDAFPDKHVLFSEGCNYPFSWDKFDDWKWGENYGRSMIGDFNNWTCAWTDWNVLLDEKGGPNHVANYCYAPVHADLRNGTLHYMNSYYYIGHFSKFVHPGAKRIACSTTSDVLLATAFINPDGKVVTVVMNPTDKIQDVAVWSAGQVAKTSMPSHSIITVLYSI